MKCAGFIREMRGRLMEKGRHLIICGFPNAIYADAGFPRRAFGAGEEACFCGGCSLDALAG
jgi:hypothetical protein